MTTTIRFNQNLISCAKADPSPTLFRERCQRTPDGKAYRQHDAAAMPWETV